MNNRIVSRIIWFVVLVFLQVLVFNKIHWFGCATPLVYIYLILAMGQDTSRNKQLLWAFAIGLCVDIFSNTLGIHAAASTLVAFLRPVILRMFFLRDDNEIFEPGIRAMGMGAWWSYALTFILIHHTVVFVLSFFSFSKPLLLLLCIVTSSVLTLLFLMAIELFRHRKS